MDPFGDVPVGPVIPKVSPNCSLPVLDAAPVAAIAVIVWAGVVVEVRDVPVYVTAIPLGALVAMVKVLFPVAAPLDVKVPRETAVEPKLKDIVCDTDAETFMMLVATATVA